MREYADDPYTPDEHVENVRQGLEMQQEGRGVDLTGHPRMAEFAGFRVPTLGAAAGSITAKNSDGVPSSMVSAQVPDEHGRINLVAGRVIGDTFGEVRFSTDSDGIVGQRPKKMAERRDSGLYVPQRAALWLAGVPNEALRTHRAQLERFGLNPEDDTLHSDPEEFAERVGTMMSDPLQVSDKTKAANRERMSDPVSSLPVVHFDSRFARRNYVSGQPMRGSRVNYFRDTGDIEMHPEGGPPRMREV